MRTDPRSDGDELAQLTGFLDYQRSTVLLKVQGLSTEQLRRTHPPSTLTLAGLLRHLSLDEDWWFAVQFAGRPQHSTWADVDFDADPEWEFRTAVDLTAEQLTGDYLDACQRSRRLVAGAAGLDAEAAVGPRAGGRRNLRWIVVHMIEETARHAGHADLLRESIDGSTGE